MTSHVELTDTKKLTADCEWVYRIRATRDIPEHGITAGELGGWCGHVAFPEYIAPAAWIADEAEVYDIASVQDSAIVAGTAVVDCCAEVSGTARISGSARITDDATVTGSSRVSGNVVVAGTTTIESCDIDGAGIITGHSVITTSITVVGGLDNADIRQPHHYHTLIFTSGDQAAVYRTTTGQAALSRPELLKSMSESDRDLLREAQTAVLQLRPIEGE